MKRRHCLGVFAASSIAGCLGGVDIGVETPSQEPGDQPNGSASNTDSEGESGPRFATESAALDDAGGFAAEEAVAVERAADRTPELLRHGGGSGSSSGSTDGGGLLVSQDIHFTSIPDDGIAFGGDVSRTVRVRNVTLGTAATFEPNAETQPYRVENWSFDAEKEGEPPAAIELEPVGVSGNIMLEGTWSGDTDLFRTQAFGEYVIELVEDGTRIGTTDGAVYGIRYHCGAEQTRETLYVTRQPSTNESWDAELFLGDSYFEPVATRAGTQLPAEGVFKFDLTDVDVEPGRYGWWVFIGTDDDLPRNHFISLSTGSGEVFVP